MKTSIEIYSKWFYSGEQMPDDVEIGLEIVNAWKSIYCEWFPSEKELLDYKICLSFLISRDVSIGCGIYPRYQCAEHQGYLKVRPVVA